MEPLENCQRSSHVRYPWNWLKPSCQADAKHHEDMQIRNKLYHSSTLFTQSLDHHPVGRESGNARFNESGHGLSCWMQTNTHAFVHVLFICFGKVTSSIRIMLSILTLAEFCLGEKKTTTEVWVSSEVGSYILHFIYDSDLNHVQGRVQAGMKDRRYHVSNLQCWAHASRSHHSPWRTVIIICEKQTNSIRTFC